MMKTVAVAGVALTATLVSFGSTTTVSSVSELGDSVTVGNDTLRYTGTGAETYSGTFTASPGSKLATTVDIANENGALTLEHFVQATDQFVKTGPGTLMMKTGGISFKVGDVGTYWGDTPYLTWTDGSCDAHYSPFVVHDGTLKIDFPTKEMTDKIPDSVVGHVSKSSPTPRARLEILKGTLDMGNSITIDRGAGHTADHPLQSVYVGTNGVLKGNNIWMTSRHTTSDYYGNSLLDVDGGSVEIAVDAQFGRSDGEAKILVRNGGLFSETASALKPTANKGMYFPYSSTEKLTNTFEVTGASTGRFHLATCFGSTTRTGERMKIKVTDGGTILGDAYHPMALTNNWGGGVAEFDEATIAGWYVRSASEWFPFLQAYTVGSGGLTLCAETIGALGGASRGTGEITLTGGGTIGLHPGQADVKVGTGGLRLTAPLIPTLVKELDKTGTITSSAGGTVEMVGANALGKMTLVAGIQTNAFKAFGLESDALKPGAFAGWTYCGVAVPRSDGWFHFARVNAGNVGNVWRKTKIDLTQSFKLSFDYFITHQSFAAGSYRPYGFSVIFQNTTQGPTKIGSGGRAMGFGSDTSKWANSFAFGYDSADSSMRYSRHDDGGNYFLTADGTKDKGLYITPLGATEPMRGIVTYDATTHWASFTLRSFDGKSSGTISNQVNLVERCGDSTAYLGFGAPGTDAELGTGEHFVGNVQFFLDGETPSEKVAVGGAVKVAAGKTFKAKLDTDSRAKTWSVDRLDWSDGATLEVEGDADAALGFSAFSGSGSLTKTGSGLLSLSSLLSPFTGTLTVQQGGLKFMDDSTLVPDATHWMLNEVGVNLGGGFVDKGIMIGRLKNAASATDHYVGMMNSMERMAVDKSFTITYDLKIDVYDVRGPYGYYSLCFHNDPRGAAAIGEPNGSKLATCVKIENCAGLIWAGGKDPSNSSGSAEHENQVTTVVGSNQTGGSNWTSTRPVTMAWGFAANKTYETNGTVKVVYNASAKTLYLKMTQRAGNDTNVFEHTFENFDIATAVGGNKAYLGFGANTAQSWFGLRQTITNLSIVYDDSACVDGTIALNEAQTDIVLDSATAGTLNIAKALTAPAGATVRLVNADAAAAAHVDAITCDGVLTVDGGVLAIDQGTLANVKKINLVNGAKLQVAPGATVTLPHVYLGGKSVKAGDYTDGFVTGGGTVSVNPPGMTIIVR